jgi:hypothetical protein
MLQKIKNKLLVVGGTVGGVLVAASPAFAAGGTADTAVTTALEGISNNIVATMGAVAPYGLAILAVFLGFRYGKRIFASLAKG